MQSQPISCIDCRLCCNFRKVPAKITLIDIPFLAFVALRGELFDFLRGFPPKLKLEHRCRFLSSNKNQELPAFCTIHKIRPLYCRTYACEALVIARELEKAYPKLKAGVISAYWLIRGTFSYWNDVLALNWSHFLHMFLKMLWIIRPRKIRFNAILFREAFLEFLALRSKPLAEIGEEKLRELDRLKDPINAMRVAILGIGRHGEAEKARKILGDYINRARKAILTWFNPRETSTLVMELVKSFSVSEGSE